MTRVAQILKVKPGDLTAAGPRAASDAALFQSITRRSVKGFELTAAEKEDLLAFLASLTDEAFLTNPRFQDPWPR